MSRIIVFSGKRIDLDKFEPRAKRCSHCPILQELQPRNEEQVQCGLFGWIISRSLSKRDAVCSRNTKPAVFKVTLSEKDVTEERIKNLGSVMPNGYLSRT